MDRSVIDIDHALSQEAIDALFQAQSAVAGSGSKGVQASPYDFRRTDRIPKEQIRALRAVHDTFARSLASSLSAYLRTYVTVNLISVEQLSFLEFTGCLPSPTCIAGVRMNPYDATGVLEINPSLAFPMIELLLGGGKVKPIVVEREMTTIEQNILDSLLQLILQNLGLAWQSVATVDFSIESHESEPALLRMLGPNEAIVVIATEIQIGETSGMMNIGIPSNIVKVLRQKFEQQWSTRKNYASEDEAARLLAAVKPAAISLEAMIQGSTVSMRDLLQLQIGDVLAFDASIEKPAEVLVNGLAKFEGRVVVHGRKKAVSILNSV
jgi:flagellar motor switch protein FliM